MRMGRAAESVRFLDDVDLTFSLDSRSSSSHQMTNIEIVSKPIVFRASYRDLNLITSIINKAIERYGHSQQSLKDQKQDELKATQRTVSENREVNEPKSLASTQTWTEGQSVVRARVLMSKELVCLLLC